jgi:hypothetical protein
MAREKVMLLIAIVLYATSTYAQQPNYVRAGLVRSQLTLSPGYFFADNNTYFYFHGNLEGFIEDRLSLSGDSYMFLGNQTSDSGLLKMNQSSFFGMAKHISNGRSDFYVSFQPGFSITQLNKSEQHASNALAFNPMVSTAIGYNYVFYKYFHFFTQLRYCYGNHLYTRPVGLSEIRFSAGLGFNINTVKAGK